jgi:hypothetical protein
MQHVHHHVMVHRTMRAYIACYECRFNEITRWSARWALCHTTGNVVELIAHGGDGSWFIQAADAARYGEQSASRKLRQLIVDGDSRVG